MENDLIEVGTYYAGVGVLSAGSGAWAGVGSQGRCVRGRAGAEVRNAWVAGVLEQGRVAEAGEGGLGKGSRLGG